MQILVLYIFDVFPVRLTVFRKDYINIFRCYIKIQHLSENIRDLKMGIKNITFLIAFLLLINIKINAFDFYNKKIPDYSIISTKFLLKNNIDSILENHYILQSEGYFYSFSCFETVEGSMLVPMYVSLDILRFHLESISFLNDRTRYVYKNRLTETSTDGSIKAREKITVTYSFLPDGTNIPGASFAGDSASPSDLYAKFDANFPGGRDAWKSVFSQIFQSFSNLSGITFVEVSDDGAKFPDTSGSVGKRGDVRIGMHFIGSQGAAYSYFPNKSDIVIDSEEMNYWINSYGNYMLLRNVIAHELGHGIGLNHVGPLDHTKIMEPVSGTWFDGLQLDDIRGLQREYGDDSEENNSSSAPCDIGSISNGNIKLENLSIEDNGLNDFYKFFIPSGKTINIMLEPAGKTYSVGPYGETAVLVDALRIHDLAFQLIGANGTTVLYDVNNSGAGILEVLNNLYLGEGSYFIKVFSSSPTDDIQTYSLSIEELIIINPGQIVDHILMRSTLTPSQKEAADKNKDGILDISDLVLTINN